MELKQSKTYDVVAIVALGFAAALAVSFAVAPLAFARPVPVSWQSSQSGSGYPMELIRAHANYKVVDPAPAGQVGLAVHGGR